MKKSISDIGPEMIETLLYVYITQNVKALGVLAHACPHGEMLSSLGDLRLIKEIHRGELAIVKTTDSGDAVARRIIEQRVEAFAASQTRKTINPIVARMILNIIENGHFDFPKNFPDDGFASWWNEKNWLGLSPLADRTTFDECVKFCEQLCIAGLAAITQDYSIKKQEIRGEWYVFAKEIEQLLTSPVGRNGKDSEKRPARDAGNETAPANVPSESKTGKSDMDDPHNYVVRRRPDDRPNWFFGVSKGKLKKHSANGSFNVVPVCNYETPNQVVFLIPYAYLEKYVLPRAHLETNGRYLFNINKKTFEFNWNRNVKMDGREFLIKQD